jgi:hypothetical protein
VAVLGPFVGARVVVAVATLLAVERFGGVHVGQCASTSARRCA